MTLQSLIARVEAGSGSDRQLDADICVELNWGNTKQKPLIVGHLHGEVDGMIGVLYEYGSPISYRDAPFLTSSLDAIRALFKARLEGRGLYIFAADDKLPVVIIWESGLMDDCSSDESEKSKHSDIHRAFLSAVLKAIAAKEGV